MLSPEFKIALMREVLKDDEWKSLHDTIFEATDKQLDHVQVRSVFMSLPEGLQIDALRWGVSDTVVRDEIYTFLKGEDNG